MVGPHADLSRHGLSAGSRLRIRSDASSRPGRTRAAGSASASSCPAPIATATRADFSAAHPPASSSPARKATPVAESLGERAILLALAATAHHAVMPDAMEAPELIVGHGVLGRLIARIAVAYGGEPTVWETNAARRAGAEAMPSSIPTRTSRRDYRRICDVSGDRRHPRRSGRAAGARRRDRSRRLLRPAPVLRLPAAPSCARRASGSSAEWRRDDLAPLARWSTTGALSLDGLITHTSAPAQFDDAYTTAFTDPTCLKMVLDWRQAA